MISGELLSYLLELGLPSLGQDASFISLKDFRYS